VFKLRDAYEYEYEDDEEDEEDEDDEGEEDDDEDEEEFTARRPLFKKASQAPVERPVVKTEQETETVKSSKPVQKAEAETKDTSWQSKNFLDIDDDMEFEFLDLK